jgi:acetylornithine deacetylase/succinyl-diaminopimelate desuccinylase-like protein
MSALGRSVALAAIALAAGRPLRSQGVAERSDVRRARALVHQDNAWTLDQQVALCEVPAPPFHEAARAARFRQTLQSLGFSEPVIDPAGNVIAIRRGSGGGRRLVLSAHLDTVFPEGTDVKVSRQGTRLAGPGIGDDCRGLAVLLAVARALGQAGVTTRGDLILVGTVGEEGPGNLRGVRALFRDRSLGRIDGFISIDGIGFGFVSGAVGSNRYEISFVGPGGHSFGDFGMPNPMHALGRAIAALADVTVPAHPKTTFSVGVLHGGTSVNSIAGQASFEVDLRSESPAELERVDSALRRAVDRAVDAERARWPGSSAPLNAEWRVIGRRPAGVQSDTMWLARLTHAADRLLGLPVIPPTPGSTDANVPISLGVPAITIEAGGKGSGTHSLKEWYDDQDRGSLGTERILLLVVLALET